MMVVVVVVVLAAVYVVAVVEPHRIRHFVAVSVLHPFCVDPRLHSEHLLHCSRRVKERELGRVVLLAVVLVLVVVAMMAVLVRCQRG